ncbi:DNA polymerase III alpha subunit [Candidatus Endolissoclinum faulkneri L5]|uniref:DNA polymerase III subunit alpha n=1 Tax=Candidatus Endolissoclinum faulkneri L5 TaxID=1401328 RepID=V9TS75_9PROT|nr:DNA polymerase III subunit alpha [Candidatus Endolissoclinum faulkneri]AHC73744.1 DNA polymerase III alpha subunit [Candidatus Endolissoclinum faulkneri L5]
MSYAQFIHLRVHSAYSMAEGAIHVNEIVRLAKQNAMPAVAITDSSNMFGALEFAVTASNEGVQPIVGVQLNISPTIDTKLPGTYGVSNSKLPDQLPLIAQNETGYMNLINLVSQAFLDTTENEAPLISLDNMEGRTDGLIALTGGLKGSLGRLLLTKGGKIEANTMLRRLEELFPNRLYIELQRHFLEEELQIENSLINLAYAHNLPLVATNDVFFADLDMHEPQDVLLCIAQGTTISNLNRWRVTPHHRFKTAEEMHRLFADLPEAINNTLVIARRCAVMPEKTAPILPSFETQDGRTEAEELRIKANEGLENRLNFYVYNKEMNATTREKTAIPYRKRLDMELAIIEQMGFSGYFLIVSDFIKWAKTKKIPVGPGRGSGASSLVAYSLLITDLNPLRWGLLFERFLNPERVSMPDFDIDFCQDRRDEVIHYVQKKYGRECVAQIITFGKLQARAALRDVGRVLEIPYSQVNRICKLVPNNPNNPVTLKQAVQNEKELQVQSAADKNVANLIKIALKLEGLYRNASTHAAGIVIGNKSLNNLVPLYRDPRSNMLVTQFNMKWIEQAGLVKFDFLGLKTLTVLKLAVDLLKERGLEIDLSKISLSDEQTYSMLTKGDSIGVFQLESSGMRDVLRRMRPDRFEDIVALVALYRPGPMANIEKYIACKHGEEQVDYMHPILEPVLKETFGIMIYQEQVQQAAQLLSGYTLGTADLLRRAMGKKIKKEMDAQRDKFIRGAAANGVSKNQSNCIFDQIAAFAGYGFNKSHAVAYAMISYQTSYLKANYPVEFLAASMTYEMNNTDKLNVLRQELNNLNIKLLPPDINKSGQNFSVEKLENDNYGIRYALTAIKNVGISAMSLLVSSRDKTGPFKSIIDFVDRINPNQVNKRLIENLIRAGTFDELHNNRAELFENINTIMLRLNIAASERNSEQISLFNLAKDSALQKQILPKRRPDWTSIDRLRAEFDALGFYLSANPLDSYAQNLVKMKVIASSEAYSETLSKNGKTELMMVGIVIGKQIRTSKFGKHFAVIQFTDSKGVFELTMFSKLFATSQDLLESGDPLLIRANARIKDNNLQLSASSIELLNQAIDRVASGIEIFLSNGSSLEQIKQLIEKEVNGFGRIYIIIQTSRGNVRIKLPDNYQPSSSLREAIKDMPGIKYITNLSSIYVDPQH